MAEHVTRENIEDTLKVIGKARNWLGVIDTVLIEAVDKAEALLDAMEAKVKEMQPQAAAQSAPVEDEPISREALIASIEGNTLLGHIYSNREYLNNLSYESLLIIKEQIDRDKGPSINLN